MQLIILQLQSNEINAIPKCLFSGYDNLGPMRYRGTWFVNHDDCHGYVGFVFGYQSSSKFYVVMWKHEHTNWYDTRYRGGIKGAQIKVSWICYLFYLYESSYF